MTDYSKKDIPLINLWARLNSLTETEWNLIFSRLQDDTKELVKTKLSLPENFISPISVSDDQDSYVYKVNFWNYKRVLKLYFRHSFQVILEYIKMQNTLSQYHKKYTLDEELEFNSQKIVQIQLSVLGLPENIWLCTYIGKWFMRWREALTSFPNFVPWDTLFQILPHESNETRDNIHAVLEIFFKDIYSSESWKWTDSIQNNFTDNIKILSIKNGVLYLKVTDISCDIARTVQFNKWITSWDHIQ